MLYAVFEFYTLSRKTGMGENGYMDHSEKKPSGLDSANTAFHMP